MIPFFGMQSAVAIAVDRRQFAKQFSTCAETTRRLCDGYRFEDHRHRRSARPRPRGGVAPGGAGHARGVWDTQGRGAEETAMLCREHGAMSRAWMVDVG